MADGNINMGDEGSRNQGNGNSAEIVEVTTSSAIMIESGNGNMTKDDASEGNRVVQENNGAAEQASELGKEGSGESDDDKGNGDKKEPDTGEKRSRGDADSGLEKAPEEHKLVEQVEERDAKKPKIGEAEDARAENGSSNIDGNGEKKDDKQENEGVTVEVAPKKEQKAPKKRGPGRPKKSEAKIEKTAVSARETNNGDSIGKRTRSKA